MRHFTTTFMHLVLLAALGSRVYVDLPPTEAKLAVIVSGVVNRLVLEGIEGSFANADVYMWLTFHGLHQLQTEPPSAAAVVAAVRKAVERRNGSLRFMSFEDEVDVDVGPYVKGRMSQFNVWAPQETETKRQGKAILRRWQSAGIMYNKTKGCHENVLWLREDLAPTGPVTLNSTADVNFRPCKPFGGISDKVFLFTRAAAASLLPRLVHRFKTAPRGVLRGHNPEHILREMVVRQGLTLRANRGLTYSDAVTTKGGYCFRPFYYCGRDTARVCKKIKGPQKLIERARFTSTTPR